jgi:hypothetical protein
MVEDFRVDMDTPDATNPLVCIALWVPDQFDFEPHSLDQDSASFLLRNVSLYNR